MKVCLRCGKEFTFPSTLIRHTQKKFECNAKYLDVPYDQMIEEYKSLSVAFKKSKEKIDSHQSDDQTYHKKDSGDVVCGSCSKQFTHMSNYYRHRKTCGQFKQSTIKDLQKRVNELEKQVKALQKLAPKPEAPPCDPSVLLEYGKENVEVRRQEMIKIVKRPAMAIRDLTKLLYVDRPSNRNILVISDKNGHVKVYQNKKWEYEVSSKAIKHVFDTVTEILENISDKVWDRVPSYKRTNLTGILNDARGTKTAYFMSEIKLCLLNNKDIIMPTSL